jgi:hypothetical protein
VATPQVQELLTKLGVQIPADMMQSAAKYGLRASLLMRYLDMKARLLQPTHAPFDPPLTRS